MTYSGDLISELIAIGSQDRPHIERERFGQLCLCGKFYEQHGAFDDACGNVSSSRFTMDSRPCRHCGQIQDNHEQNRYCRLPKSLNDSQAVLSPIWEPK
jgi:hypothetical protein